MLSLTTTPARFPCDPMGWVPFLLLASVAMRRMVQRYGRDVEPHAPPGSLNDRDVGACAGSNTSPEPGNGRLQVSFAAPLRFYTTHYLRLSECRFFYSAFFSGSNNAAARNPPATYVIRHQGNRLIPRRLLGARKKPQWVYSLGPISKAPELSRHPRRRQCSDYSGRET